jgi:hypothetical protein
MCIAVVSSVNFIEYVLLLSADGMAILAHDTMHVFFTLQSCSIIVVAQANGKNCLKQVTLTMVTRSGTKIGIDD